MSDLSSTFVQYRRGSVPRSRLIEAIVQFAQIRLHARFHLTREQQHEILNEFYPRLENMCDNYHYQGKSFEAYVFSTLRYFCRTWHRRQMERIDREVLIGESQSELFVCEDPAPAVEDDLTPYPLHPVAGVVVSSRFEDAFRRQILICLCKNIPLLSDADAQRYATRLSLPYAWIEAVQRATHERTVQVRERTERMKRHRNRHYVKMIQCERAEGPTSDRALFHRRMWLTWCDRLKRQRVHLSNSEVALLLGIPKGSVDSAMTNLTRRLAQSGRPPVRSGHARSSARLKQCTQAHGDGRHSPPAQRSGGDRPALRRRVRI